MNKMRSHLRRLGQKSEGLCLFMSDDYANILSSVLPVSHTVLRGTVWQKPPSQHNESAILSR